MKLALLALSLFAGLLLVGCGSGNVDEGDVKDWENQGRAPGDKAVDPNTGRDR